MTIYAEEISLEEFQAVIRLYNSTMDDYLYFFDLVKDVYCISPNAVERFRLPSELFENTGVAFRELIYADDFDMLNADLEEVKAGKKDSHNIEYRWMDREGKVVWINCRGNVVRNKDGTPRYLVGCINEIGKNQKADNISGLLRETVLCREIAQRQDNLKGCMLRIGIDHFKEINENKGMDYGDMILRRTADCIKEVISPNQKLFRIVADEFLIVDFDEQKEINFEKLYKKIRRKIDAFIENNGYEVFYTVSAGILNFEVVQDKSFANLMKLTEFALNEAKRRGRNRYYTYEREDYLAFLRKRSLTQLMRQAINHNFEGFETYFQPIVDAKGKRLYGAEALLRFKTEETGPVSPAEFVPLLEESGLIIPVGKWVMRQAMSACREIRKKIPDFCVSVNLSYVQILKSDVLTEIEAGIRYFGLNPGSIVVELTESGKIESSVSFLKFREGLKKNSVALALDDFGTGYSNFHYLYHLNPDTIKIDRSFTMKALRYDYEYNILKHMINMSHGIKLKLCVEGIETEEELKKVSEMNPDFIQGYYFGKPCSLEQFYKEHLDKM